MAYRAPVSDIYLLKNCQCDKDYNNSVRFVTKKQQITYFLSTLPTLHYTPATYQRKGNGKIRIQAYAEDLQRYNYLIFSNAPINTNLVTNDTIIYYCFIDSCDYINDNVTEISYSIDVLQTYMFDYKLGYSFVEREHSETDNLYEHLEAEPFTPTDFCYSLANSYNFSDLSVCITYVPNNHWVKEWYFHPLRPASEFYIVFVDAGTGVSGRGFSRNKMPCGVARLAFPLTFNDQFLDSDKNQTNFASALDALHGTTDIVDISILPTVLCPHTTYTDPDSEYPDLVRYREFWYPDKLSYTYEGSSSIQKITSFNDQKGTIYTPKNKKLLSYPYVSLISTNEQGNQAETLFENYSASTDGATFKCVGAVNGSPEVQLIPYNYNGKVLDLDNAVSIQNFSTAIFSFDSAKLYWEQNKAQITSNIIKGALLMATGVKMGGKSYTDMAIPASKLGVQEGTSPFVGNAMRYAAKNKTEFDYTLEQTRSASIGRGAIYGAGIMANQIATLIDAKEQPDKAQGSQSYSQLPVLNNAYGLKVFYKTVKPYYAKQIDTYFSLFGYAVKRLKIPNLFDSTVALRPHWNYLKVGYCFVEPYTDGNTTRCVPQDVEEALQAIYQKGVTFWTNERNIGDYSLNNAPA